MNKIWRVVGVILLVSLFVILAFNHNFHFWVTQAVAKGGDYKTLLWLLLFPWVVTLLSFFRQVVGLKTYGIYIPSVLAVALFAIGWRFGILFLIVVLFVGTILRFLLSSYRILDLPRRAIIMIGISLSLVFVLILSIKEGYFLSRLAPVAIFPVLIIIVASERFITSQMRLPFKKSLSYTFQTLFVVFIAVLFIRWGVIQNLTWEYPEIILFLVLINFLLGRYTGLRLTELIRFRKLIFK